MDLLEVLRNTNVVVFRQGASIAEEHVDYVRTEVVQKFINDQLTEERTDWTAKDGRSNSSELFGRIAARVAELIRNDAHMLRRGRSDATGRLIVAQLAHDWGMAPVTPHEFVGGGDGLCRYCTFPGQTRMHEEEI